MRRTIFMTGATGTVGSELLRRLMTRDDTTINILVRRAGYDRRPLQRPYVVSGSDAWRIFDFQRFDGHRRPSYRRPKNERMAMMTTIKPIR